ncbi:28292_t:CDS:2, partial [Racocetra persica]
TNSESIENFVADYEGYAAMKDWDEVKIRLKDVKAAILKSGKVKYDVEMKIERLMNLKLNEDESIVSYTNRFDACAKKVTNEVSDREAIKIEKFEKSDKFDIKKASVIGEESTYQTDPAVDELADTFSDLKICRVSLGGQGEKNPEKIYKLEATINELTRILKNMNNNNNTQLNRNQ